MIYPFLYVQFVGYDFLDLSVNSFCQVFLLNDLSFLSISISVIGYLFVTANIQSDEFVFELFLYICGVTIATVVFTAGEDKLERRFFHVGDPETAASNLNNCRKF